MTREALYGAWVYVRKDQHTADELAFMRRTLTIERKKPGQRGEPLPPTALYVESERYFGLPRAYFDQTYRDRYELTYAFPDHLDNPWEDPVPFHGTLFPEQHKALNIVQNIFLPGSFAGGILWAPPGWGKTTWSCAAASALKAKTLMVVHREFLVDQWIQRIGTYLPGARVGRVQGKTCDYRGCHVVIGLVHSLAKLRYTEDFYDYFDMVLVDEVHTTAGASSWAAVPALFSAPWRMGVTATPRRKDAAENVFLYQIGPVIFHSSQARLPLDVRTVPTDFQAVWGEDVDRDKLILHLCQDEARNRLIVAQMLQALDAGRKLFVLSERVEHLQTLDVLLRGELLRLGKELVSTGHYIGGTDTELRELSSRARVVFATAQLASAGLDIVELDTFFPVTPLSDIEQAAGRLLRPHPTKKTPIAVDFVDRHIPMFVRAHEARQKQYARLRKTDDRYNLDNEPTNGE